MQLSATILERIDAAARRRGIEAAALRSAIAGESAAELAAALGIGAAEARAHMARLERAVTVQSDIGAGCALLSDDVEREVLAALAWL